MPPARPGWRLLSLRCAYLTAALACVVMGWLTVTKAAFALVLPDARVAVTPPMFRFFIDIIWYGQLGFSAFLFVVMLFLMVRPWWWGKLLRALMAVGWLGFCAVAVGRFGFIPTIQVISAAGATMACVAIAHQVIDPRFDGAPWRA
jgi:hypothetical protein